MLIPTQKLRCVCQPVQHHDDATGCPPFVSGRTAQSAGSMVLPIIPGVVTILKNDREDGIMRKHSEITEKELALFPGYAWISRGFSATGHLQQRHRVSDLRLLLPFSRSCFCKFWSANLIFTLTRRLFLVYFSPRHRLFFTPGRAGGCLCYPATSGASPT